MAGFQIGEEVQGEGVNSGALYKGRVIRKYGNFGGECKIRITEIIGDRGIGQRVGTEANIKNVQRSSEVAYVSNLVGPKPEPTPEPKFVTPFRSDGSNVVDANGKIVIRIQYGGYTPNAYRSELPMAERYELARLVAEAPSEKFAAKVEDSKSPF
jgi:ribosomal protein L35AE/L33A